MKQSSLARFLFAFLVAVALACTPNLVLAQHHGGGSHGGGSHGGGFRGGGSHGHSSHGSGHFGGGGHSRIFGGGHQSYNGGGGRGFFSGRGFRGSNHGNFSSRNFGAGMYSGRAPTRSSSATTFNNSRRAFSSGIFRNSGSVSNGQWRSFGNGRFASLGRPSGASAFGTGGGWHGFGNHENSFATARTQSSPWQGSASRSGNSQSYRTSTTGSGWNTFSRSATNRWESNGPRDSRAFADAWPGKRGSAISTNRVLSNFGTRFSHSRATRFPFADSRFGSRSRAFDGREFGNRYGFQRGEGGFGGREFWSNDSGDAYSLLPDLFGLALGFGNFALRGFNFLGPGLDLLASAFSGDVGYGGSGYGSDDGFGGYGEYGVGFTAPPPATLMPLEPLSPYWVPNAVPYVPESAIFWPR